MPHLTPEQRKDVDERVELFRKGHEKLRTELQVDIGYAPMFAPVSGSMFGVVVNSDYIDLKYRAPSPIMAGPDATKA